MRKNFWDTLYMGFKILLILVFLLTPYSSHLNLSIVIDFYLADNVLCNRNLSDVEGVGGLEDAYIHIHLGEHLDVGSNKDRHLCL